MFRGLPCLLSLFLVLASFAAAQEPGQFNDAIANGSVEQKRDALFLIRNLRSADASRAALPALRDAAPIVRATAASSVVFLPKPEAVAALVPLLADDDEFVRREAAHALGTVGSPDAAAALIRAMQRDKDLEVRSAAAVALGFAGDRSAVEPLLALLQRRPSEESEFLRRSAARSVGQIARVARGLPPDVATPQNFLPEKYKSVDLGDSRPENIVFRAAVPILSAVLQNRREADDTRREAAFALGAIGSPSAIGLLRSHLNSPDPYLAEIAKEALLKIEITQNGELKTVVLQ